MDLGTSRTSVSASNGVRETVYSTVGYPKDHVASKLLQKDVLFGKEAIEKRMSLRVYKPLEKGVIKAGPDADEDAKANMKAAQDLIGEAIRLAKPRSDELVYCVIGAPAEASMKNREAIIEAAREHVDGVAHREHERDGAEVASPGRIDDGQRRGHGQVVRPALPEPKVRRQRQLHHEAHLPARVDRVRAAEAEAAKREVSPQRPERRRRGARTDGLWLRAGFRRGRRPPVGAPAPHDAQPAPPPERPALGIVRARARRGVLPAVDAAAPVGDPVARPAPAPGRRRAALGVDVVAARGRVAHQLVGACVQTSRAIRRRGLS